MPILDTLKEIGAQVGHGGYTSRGRLPSERRYVIEPAVFREVPEHGQLI
jgi:hypothetical protein